MLVAETEISSVAGRWDPQHCLCPLGQASKWGDPLWATLSQGCFVLWGLGVLSSRGEMTPRNPRQSAWKIPGSLIFTPRTCLRNNTMGEPYFWYNTSLRVPRCADTPQLGQAPARPRQGCVPAACSCPAAPGQRGVPGGLGSAGGCPASGRDRCCCLQGSSLGCKML